MGCFLFFAELCQDVPPFTSAVVLCQLSVDFSQPLTK